MARYASRRSSSLWWIGSSSTLPRFSCNRTRERPAVCTRSSTSMPSGKRRLRAGYAPRRATYGQWLSGRWLRLSHRLPQRALSPPMSRQQQYVARIEDGERRMHPQPRGLRDRLLHDAGALADYLLGRTQLQRLPGAQNQIALGASHRSRQCAHLPKTCQNSPLRRDLDKFFQRLFRGRSPAPERAKISSTLTYIGVTRNL